MTSPCSFNFCILSRCCAASFSYVTFSFARRFTTPVLILSVLIRGSDIICEQTLHLFETSRTGEAGTVNVRREIDSPFALFSLFCLIRQGRVDRNCGRHRDTMRLCTIHRVTMTCLLHFVLFDCLTSRDIHRDFDLMSRPISIFCRGLFQFSISLPGGFSLLQLLSIST